MITKQQKTLLFFLLLLAGAIAGVYTHYNQKQEPITPKELVAEKINRYIKKVFVF